MSILSFLFGSRHAIASPDAKSIHDLSVKTIEGREISLSEFKGKVLLVVNTASRCGFTSQYEGLESLHEKYNAQGFEVLGFPSNDFLGQEPGSNEEIKQFCKLNYDVSFPLFSKAPVSGAEKQPLFRVLTEESGEGLSGEVRWNFEKFLIGKDGKLVDRWRSMTSPTSSKIVDQIEKLLAPVN